LAPKKKPQIPGLAVGRELAARLDAGLAVGQGRDSAAVLVDADLEVRIPAPPIIATP
jgi:xanthosine utilization system XapX-like protein